MSGELTAPYGDVRPARVRHGVLRQHDVYMLDEGRTLVLGAALGPPRLWSYLLDVALGGFVEGHAQPHDGRASTRLHQGLRCAQMRLRARAEVLIERRMPEVGLLALSLEGTVLHVLSAGPLTAFVHRHHRSQKVGPREGTEGGLLKNASGWSAEPVEPGDMVFAGSQMAWAPTAIQELDQQLSRADLEPSQVVELLNRTAAANGTSALAVAMRVPNTPTQA